MRTLDRVTLNSSMIFTSTRWVVMRRVPVYRAGSTHCLSGASHADVALGISESQEAQQHHLPQIEQGWLLA